MQKTKKYIIYTENGRHDMVIEAKNLKGAKLIAKRELGKEGKAQEYSKEDQEVWG